MLKKMRKKDKNEEKRQKYEKVRVSCVLSFIDFEVKKESL